MKEQTKDDLHKKMAYFTDFQVKGKFPKNCKIYFKGFKITSFILGCDSIYETANSFTGIFFITKHNNQFIDS